jgi:hypothetical protein
MNFFFIYEAMVWKNLVFKSPFKNHFNLNVAVNIIPPLNKFDLDLIDNVGKNLVQLYPKAFPHVRAETYEFHVGKKYLFSFKIKRPLS